MSHNIIGYSERGIIYSFFYEIATHEKGGEIVSEFFRNVIFENGIDKELSVQDFQIIIEPSLSDFGDSDVVLLVDCGKNGKITLFIEAKVKTYSRTKWLIQDEYSKIFNGNHKMNSSNLFVQLYHKRMFFNALKEKGIKGVTSIEFPPSSSKETRKIGENPIVLKIVDKIHEYKSEAFYIGIIPENKGRILDWYNQGKLKDFQTNEIGLENLGFVPWENIEEICSKYKLRISTSNFEFNKGQIY